MSETNDRSPSASHWQRVHAEREPTSVSWYQARPQDSLELIEESGLGPEARILDVGGGLSTLVDHLLGRGFEQVHVLDISANALDLSRARLGDRAGDARWIVSDVLELDAQAQLGGLVELWHDRAVFHFLVTEEARSRYLQRLREALAPGGFALLATFADDGPERCSGLPVRRYSPEQLVAEVGDDLELLSSRRALHRTPAGAEQRFIYVLLRRAR